MILIINDRLLTQIGLNKKNNLLASITKMCKDGITSDMAGPRDKQSHEHSVSFSISQGFSLVLASSSCSLATPLGRWFLFPNS